MKIDYVSPAAAAARAWLTSWWPKRARTVAQEYAAARDEYPLMFADMARAGCAFDSTIGPDRDTTLVNTGKRELWLHIAAMTEFDADSLRRLEQETDHD